MIILATEYNRNHIVRFAWIVSLLAILLLVTGSTLAQQKKPISKSGLLESIRLNGLSTRELVDRIEQRGVSFQMTAADEEEFRAAGARPEIIAAARANYRSATPANTT